MRLFLWLTLSFAMLLPGQEIPSIRVDVNLVNVTFTVHNQDGRLVKDLASGDFEVLEDGVPQEIRFFGRSAEMPLRMALLIDASRSQEKFNRDHQKDMERFLRATLTPSDKALLIGFGNHVRVVSDFGSDSKAAMERFTRYVKGDREGMAELDRDDTREGGTAIFDSVVAVSKERLSGYGKERKAIILMSDGEDNASAHDVVDAIEAAQMADVLIYTVRYTEAKRGQISARNRFGKTEMDRMARETGGVAFDASRGKVAESLTAIGEELRNLYDIGYTTTNLEGDGGFRKIQIRVKRPGYVVRAKSGYYSARP